MTAEYTLAGRVRNSYFSLILRCKSGKMAAWWADSAKPEAVLPGVLVG